MIGYDDMMYYQSVGETRGFKMGVEQGIERGISQEKENIILNFAKKHQNVDFIAEVVEMDKAEVQAILSKHVQA